MSQLREWCDKLKQIRKQIREIEKELEMAIDD